MLDILMSTSCSMEVSMSPYKRVADLERVVFLVPPQELKQIDEWGVPAGMANRSQAIRELIRIGLRQTNCLKNEKGAEVSA